MEGPEKPMSKPLLFAGIVLLACAFVTEARGADWPTHYTFTDGTDLGLTAAYRYDINDFSDDTLPNGSHRFEDSATNRRKELGITLRKKGVYDAIIDREFETTQWLDVYLRVQSKAFLGKDFGAFRFGYSKTPVGLEGATSTRADSFLELSLPEQAMYEGRRTGFDWALERPAFIVNLAYYFGQDLQGDNDGTTLAGRFAWTPIKTDAHVLHLGVSASRENPDSTVNGLGKTIQPSARVRSTPEAGLTMVRLVDTGALSNVDHIDRRGLEGLWIEGPWSLQGEYLDEKISRFGGKPDADTHGFYTFGSWVVTGESRPYANGNVGNIKPQSKVGAVELLLRYSELDLDSGTLHGGREHDWTLGANWYLTDHFKFQGNYIRTWANKSGLQLSPKICELRFQLMF
jgi:phosphate-selective porin OprO/OprP